jgi:hypothetical protein
MKLVELAWCVYRGLIQPSAHQQSDLRRPSPCNVKGGVFPTVTRHALSEFPCIHPVAYLDTEQKGIYLNSVPLSSILYS